MKRRLIDEELDWGFNSKYPDYEISENGDVWDAVRERYVKVCRVGGKPTTVNLRKRDGSRHDVALARLVLETFRGERGSDYRAYFRDGDKRNLHIDNLVWREVMEPGRKTIREWIPGHPEISLTDFYRNTYVRVQEAERIYYNIWSYIEATGEDEMVAKKCIKNPYGATNSKGQHIVPYLYDDGNGKIIENLEELYV